MKLAAIYNVWDGDELLHGSMEAIRPCVDVFIIVYQNISNSGEEYCPDICNIVGHNIHKIKYTPELKEPYLNETKKRNIGIAKAFELGCSHFILMDCDEYYKADEFYNALKLVEGGAVCKMHTYFKYPTLKLSKPEGYYVPFVHLLHSHTQAGVGKYPFYVDRTRTINEKNVIEIPESVCMMHHFSWVRKDIERKARNSSAWVNIKRSSLISDYHNAHDGMYLKDYNDILISCEDTFKVNKLVH